MFICPKCGNNLVYSEMLDVWQCEECDFYTFIVTTDNELKAMALQEAREVQAELQEKYGEE